MVNIRTCIDFILYHAHPGPPTAPQNLTMSTICTTAVVLSWSPPQDSGGMGTVFYTVYYQALISGSSRMTWGDVTTTSVTVTNLLPATEYRMTVVALSGAPGEEGISSISIMFTTQSSSVLSSSMPCCYGIHHFQSKHVYAYMQFYVSIQLCSLIVGYP